MADRRCPGLRRSRGAGRMPTGNWRSVLTLGVLLVALAIRPVESFAAERVLDFSRLSPGGLPADFRPALTGGGGPVEWRILQVPVGSLLPSLTGLTSPNVTETSETVLAQLSEDPTDERFPLLIYEPEIYADFTATLRFRTMRGQVERMAGLAFRLQDERNYYVVRASSLGKTLRFYKFVEGVRSEPIGVEVPIPPERWQTLEVTCEGNSIRVRLNDEALIPQLNDTSFTRGKVALWTKSDSVSHFASLRIVFDPLKTLPQRLVDAAIKKYPRLLGVTVFARSGDSIRAMAATDATLIGSSGSEAESRALDEAGISAGSGRDHAMAVFPLRDRNGEPVFALRLKLRTFSGQTEANIAARGRPIATYLQALISTADPSAE